MHTTALCSPTRSCVLTGRNHHSNAMACITEGSEGYPGANGAIPFENGFLSEILLGQGYNTYAFGKWHLTPAEQISAAGPYDRWPLGRGFERYYGFLGGDTSQYYPDLVYDNRQVEPPKTPEEGYHLTPDLVDNAISFISDSKQLAPDKPFFIYFATGAQHAPHHVPKEWADKYKGKFDDGWDAFRERVFARQKALGIIPQNTVLSRHDPDVQDWNKLSADERRLYARMMEVFAGFLEHTDHHIGRLIDYLAATGELDNTLIMLISDNGASSEGGPTGSDQREQVLQQRARRIEGESRRARRSRRAQVLQPLRLGMDLRRQHSFQALEARDVSWWRIRPFPRALAEGGQGQGRGPASVRARDRHGADRARCSRRRATDANPRRHAIADRRRELRAHVQRWQRTLKPSHPVFRDVRAPRDLSRRLARGVPVARQTPSPRPRSFSVQLELTEDKLRELDATGWELYNLTDDPAETNNLAGTNRAKLIEMIALWYVEAGKYNVLPLDSRGTARFADERPQLSKERQVYVYYPGTQTVPENVAVKVLNRAHTLTAEVEVPKGGANGVLVCHGSNAGGYTLFVKDNKLHYVHNYVGAQEFRVESSERIPEGKSRLRYQFEPTGKPDIAKGKGSPGRAQLYINDKMVGQTDFPFTVPLLMALGGGLTVGRNPGSSVSQLYGPPFAFTGTIFKVTADVSGQMLQDSTEERDANAKRALARQ